MKIALLSIGKTDNRLFKEIIDEYVKRLNYYIPFEDIYIPDIKNRKSISEVEQKNLEGDKLIKALELTDYIVLLDEKGKKFNSSGFANYIEKKMHTVPKRLVERFILYPSSPNRSVCAVNSIEISGCSLSSAISSSRADLDSGLSLALFKS
jgi:23S rRNA pseudoU1915 N3-methylase RlmH